MTLDTKRRNKMAIEEIEIEGFVGQNPKYSSNSNYPGMLSFSVGVSQSTKNKETDKWESKTTWYDVVSWNGDKSKYIFEKVLKGDKVVVKGRPSVKVWNGKDGQPKAAISINLTKMALMKKEGDGGNNNELPAYTPTAVISPKQVEEFYDDPIPF
jgi:single-stranded DNA-binding protein